MFCFANYYNIYMQISLLGQSMSIFLYKKKYENFSENVLFQLEKEIKKYLINI